MNAVSEILMLGRGLHYGIWIVTQRADAALFANGSRDIFMCILALGRLSKEQKNMLFSGEELPERSYQQGEGVILLDGREVEEVRFRGLRMFRDGESTCWIPSSRARTVTSGAKAERGCKRGYSITPACTKKPTTTQKIQYLCGFPALKTLFAPHKQKKHKNLKPVYKKGTVICNEPIKRNRNKNPKTMGRTKEK